MVDNQTNQKSDLFNFIVKALIVGVIATLSIGGGIYVGTVYSRGGQTISSPKDFKNTSYLTKGEKFPSYDLYNLQTSEFSTIEELAAEKPTLLLFLSNSCTVCFDLISNWQLYVFDEISPDINVAFVFDNEIYLNISDVDEIFLVNNAILFTTSRVEQYPIDGFVGSPTIVGLKGGSEIAFISSGYDMRIDAKLIKKLLTK